MRWHSNGFTFRTTDCWNINGGIGKVIICNFDGMHDSLETVCNDTIAVIKLASTENVLPILNNFYQNIKFTFELEQERQINFLEILFIRRNDTLKATIY